jgi:transcriptional regulator with XRE-family HTH domain
MPVTNDMPTFKENLKRLRLDRGLTLQGLATLAGMSMSGVTQMESGAIPDPRLSTVRALAKALGVGVEELIGDEEEPPAAEPPPAPPKRGRRKGK